MISDGKFLLLKKGRMGNVKKLVTFVYLFILLFTITACKNEATNASEDQESRNR